MRITCVAAALVIGLTSPLAAQVSVLEESMIIPTWEIGSPEVHPAFTARIGSIYPYSMNDILTDRKVDKVYRAIVLENEYIKILVLPEIGGRIHGALDKTNGYEWLYWQKTIKPGLISLTGAWISGGIEWNFPRGHRPSGFMPVEHRIVRHDDGSATVWVGETEPVYRMRWLVGITAFPGRSYIRCDYVFVNPTSHRQSFQYWSTSATYANDWTQAQYPGSVVTGHGKHEFWNWPLHNGVDLTWWKNSPNAASYFAVDNPSDWFGTYDHRAGAGMVHVADHHVMPGKKLWTWGSGPSGRIWEEILSDGGGAYFEPQAGAWSDNQPDFHWLWPNEVKTAHDYWYPVRDTRGYHNATRDLAINTDLSSGVAFGAVYATSVVRDCKVVFENVRTKEILSEARTLISPDKPFTTEARVPNDTTVFDLRLSVYDASGRLQIDLQQQRPTRIDLPAGLEDPGDPKRMTPDELHRSGEWLDKFLRRDEALVYYQEALARDPADSFANAELGFERLKQGEWREALGYLDKALARDGDSSRLHFGRGQACRGLGEDDLAYREFYRATYTYDFASAAYFNLAKLDLKRGAYDEALAKLAQAARQNERFADLLAHQAAALRHSKRFTEALSAADGALDRDALHFMGAYERALALEALGRPATERTGWDGVWRSILRGSIQNYLELATTYIDAGLYDEAAAVLAKSPDEADESTSPSMATYLRGYVSWLSGNRKEARASFDKAARGPVEYVNPHRLEERAALEVALGENPQDGHAHLFLGNFLYAKGRREAGLEHWRKAVTIDSRLMLAWRNIGYAENDLRADFTASLEAYRRAAQLGPDDARVLLEWDQVAEKLRKPVSERLTFLEARMPTVEKRDNLVSRWIELLLDTGEPSNLAKALDVLTTRHFHNWEGSYGVHEAWVEVNRRLGDLAFARGDLERAAHFFLAACEYPKNLEVAPRTPDFRAHLYWDLARLNTAMARPSDANDYLQRILGEKYGKPHLGTLYQARAQKALNNLDEYEALLNRLERTAREYLSGKYEYRGDRETVGHYLLSLVLDERGDKAGADRERQAALNRHPHAERLTVLDAQLDTASAHQ